MTDDSTDEKISNDTNPALGLDRSVRLGDVVAEIRAEADGWDAISPDMAAACRVVADRVARGFGGPDA